MASSSVALEFRGSAVTDVRVENDAEFREDPALARIISTKPARVWLG